MIESIRVRRIVRGQLDRIVAQESQQASFELHGTDDLPQGLRAVSQIRLFGDRISLRVQELPLVGGLLCCSAVVAMALGKYFNPLFAVVAFMSLVYACYAYFERRRAQEIEQYAVDLPSMLLAMSANMKIGLPAYAAMERATKLLSKDNVIRGETEAFLATVHRGVPYSDAIQDFGASVPLADLELFRKAFLLVVEHGGQFAPTLERLAQLGRERALLLQSLRARTSGMRMTANALLLIAPMIMLMLAARIDNFWQVLLTHDVASTLGIIGVAMILLGCGFLRQMGKLRI